MSAQASSEMELVEAGKLPLRTLIVSTLGVAGCLALGWFLVGPAARRLTVWKPTTCAIHAAHISEKDGSFRYSSGGDDRGRGSTQHTVSYKEYAPLVTFDYAAEGQEYRCLDFDALKTGQNCLPTLEAERTSASALAAGASNEEPDFLERLLAIPPRYSRDSVDGLLQRFQPGSEVQCWYDRASPRQPVLLRRIEWFHVAVLGFLALGVAAFLADIYVSSRPKYRVAPLFTVPLPAKTHVSASGNRGVAFLGVGAIVLFISVFVYMVSFMWLIGDWPILITLIVAPFALLALILVGAAIHDLFTLRTGKVSAELEVGDLKPGNLVRARVIQRGPAKLGKFSARLVVTEVEKRRNKGGKSTQVTRTVHEQDVVGPTSLKLKAGRYFDEVFNLGLPEGLSDSRLKWTLVVKRRLRLIPMLNEDFPLPMQRGDRESPKRARKS